VRTRKLLDILGAVVFGTILLAMIVLAVLIPWLSIQTGFLAFVAIVGISAALTLFFLAKVAGRPTLEMLRGLWRASRRPASSSTSEGD
jgi:hypothetical protein